MSKILDKLGIYDMVAVLLAGINISTFSIIVMQLIYKIPIDVSLQVNETLLFFVLSYFLGLIFQEISSLIQKKITHKNNRLLKAALKTSNNSHIYLTDTEKDGVYDYIIGKLQLNSDDDNNNVVYNYCKFYILENIDTTRIDKDQSISSMGRSLSLYFAVLASVVLINIFFQPSLEKIVLVIISVCFSILLYYRCIRFAKLRYINIFRTFYYKVVIK